MTQVYPAHFESDVVLRNGRTLRVRPVRPDDRDALLSFYRGLSPDSLYMRFFDTRTPEAALRGYGAGRFSFNVGGGRCDGQCPGGGDRDPDGPGVVWARRCYPALVPRLHRPLHPMRISTRPMWRIVSNRWNHWASYPAVTRKCVPRRPVRGDSVSLMASR